MKKTNYSFILFSALFVFIVSTILILWWFYFGSPSGRQFNESAAAINFIYSVMCFVSSALIFIFIKLGGRKLYFIPLALIMIFAGLFSLAGLLFMSAFDDWAKSFGG